MQSITPIFETPTSPSGGAASTSCPPASPASRSVLPASGQERIMTATSGRKLSGSLGKYGLAGLLAKTLMESQAWYSPARKLRWESRPIYSERHIKYTKEPTDTSSTGSVVILKQSDMKLSRSLYRLVPSERRTKGCDAFSSAIILKTPCAMDGRTGNGKRNFTPGNTGTLGQQIMGGYLPTISRLLPTAQTQGLKICKNRRSVPIPLAMLPTPTVNDAANMSFPESQRKRDSVVSSVMKELRIGPDSRLNPLYVAEMMGFPERYLVLPFLAGGGRVSRRSATR